MNPVIDRLRRDFQDPEYRHVYDEGFLDSSIATQIRTLREQRKWSQEKLASATGMRQSRISEIEDTDYSSWSIRTLRRLAKAFDLRLRVSFEEFGTLLSDFTKLNRNDLERRSFSDDPAFKVETGRSIPPLREFIKIVEPTDSKSEGGSEFPREEDLINGSKTLGVSSKANNSEVSGVLSLGLQVLHSAGMMGDRSGITRTSFAGPALVTKSNSFHSKRSSKGPRTHRNEFGAFRRTRSA